MNVTASAWFVIGAIAGGIAVMLGAFGAHGLKARVDPELLAVFETGVRYHMYHALALLAVGLARAHWPTALISSAGWFFLAGILIFSNLDPVGLARASAKGQSQRESRGKSDGG